MFVIPVLDLLNGQVVRGIAGHRSKYRPIVSRLTNSTDPIGVAQALQQSFGFQSFYVADLDAILHRRPNLAVYRQLKDIGFETFVDAGVHGVVDINGLIDAGATRVIVGLETCASPAVLAEMIEATPDLIFSLDLQQGIPRRPANSSGWSDDAFAIVRQAVTAHVRSILVLDLADVGTGTGGSTDSLCRQIRAEFPEMHLIAGGGVRGPDDLRRLKTLGAHQVLVASALHDGRLGREDLAAFQNDSDKVGSSIALGS